jgi:hypothetical protein
MKSLRTAFLAIAVGALALASTALDKAKSFGSAVAEDIHAAATGFMRGAGFILGVVTLADTYTGKYPVLMNPPRSDVLEVVIPFALPAANVANGDVLSLCKVPAGVKIIDWMIYTDDADSNGAPAIAYSLGTLNSASAPTALTTTYKSGITTAQSGALQRCDTTAAQLESTAAERPVGILFTAAAATYVAGKTGALVLKLADA